MPVVAPAPRASRPARPRTHLTAVPSPKPAVPAAVPLDPAAAATRLVDLLGPATADDVARDAERELACVADALHDGPVQAVLAASYALELARRAGPAPAGDGTPGLAEAREALGEALTSLRRAMGELRPPGVQGGLGGMLAALAERSAALRLDDRATGAVSATLSGAVFRLLASLGATRAGEPLDLAVGTRDRRDAVLLEVRMRGAGSAERTRREEVARALRRLDALGARVAVARATGGADLLIALPADTTAAPAPTARPALLDDPGRRRLPEPPALAPTGTETWR